MPSLEPPLRRKKAGWLLSSAQMLSEVGRPHLHATSALKMATAVHDAPAAVHDALAAVHGAPAAVHRSLSVLHWESNHKQPDPPFTWLLGFELRSSCLHSKQALSSALNHLPVHEPDFILMFKYFIYLSIHLFILGGM